MLSNFVIGDDSDSDFDLPVKRSSMFRRGVTTLRGSVRKATRVMGKITTKTVFGGVIGDSSDSTDSEGTGAVRVYNYPSSNRNRRQIYDEDDIFEDLFFE